MKKSYALVLALFISLVSFSQNLIISEFRYRGPNGANDEFIEIYNNSDAPVTVAPAVGSVGYAIVPSDGLIRAIIPVGTVIPARGHYLVVNSVGYSLTMYPGGIGATATGNASYTTNIPENAGIALFNTSNAANFTMANRLDAVGSTAEANPLYKEGAGLPTLSEFNIEYSWHRKQISGRPKETNDNAADFKFDETNGTSAGAGQSLGSPGPENLSSPVVGTGGLVVTYLDQAQPSNLAPNFVRDLTSDQPNNSVFGTIDLRFKITNNTAASVTRLRLRIVDITTFPGANGKADLRARTSSDLVVPTSMGNVTVRGTELESPPNPWSGGGFNSTLSVNNIALLTPLGAGATEYIHVLLGVQQAGPMNVKFVIEALPEGGSGYGGTGAGATYPFGYSGTDVSAFFNGDLLQAGDVVINEFRLKGPNGNNDEFVELYNTTDHDITVMTKDGSSGWALAASNGTARFIVPNGTVIKARGHFLGVNSVGYSLTSYPAGNGTTATGDATYTTDIPNNAGIALFQTSNPANFNMANRLDAAGSTTESNVLYKEGAGYAALTPFSIDYSFYRNTNTPNAQPLDNDNNAIDFKFGDTNGTSAGAGQNLGAPGPQNMSSPITGNAIEIKVADPAVAPNLPPNMVRDFISDPPNNSTYGTISLRYSLKNIGNVAITRLRLRIDSLNTFPSVTGVADLRPRTSSPVVIALPTGNTTMQGTMLEQPPTQPNGGGFNSSMSVGFITLANPLAAGDSVFVQILIGVQQAGAFTFKFTAEGLPQGGGLNGQTVLRAHTDCAGIIVTNPATTTGTLGAPFSQSFTSTGGTGTVTYTTASTLPAGLTLAANGTLSGTPTQTGTFPITVTATDAAACTGTSAVYSLVIDCLPVTVTCPANMTVSNTPGQCGAIVNYPAATATGGATITYSMPSGSFFPVGTTTVTATATNNCETKTCTFTVKVNDTQAPVVTCPANIVTQAAQGQCTKVVTFTPTATDNCSGVTITTSPVSGSTFNVGTTTVNVTATDASGNVATCSFTVTVTDGQMPVVTTHPVDVVVCAGSTASFTVTATNVVSYQWQVNTGNGFSNINGATAATLTVNNVTIGMNDNKYRVMVKGMCSTIPSNEAILTVNPLPTVTIQASPYTALHPGLLTTIYANHDHTPGTFAWYRDNVLTETTNNPLLPNLDVDDLGTYKVIYTDNKGCTDESNTVTLVADPNFQFFVYPTPNTGQFTIRFYTQTLGVKRVVRVMDAKGATVVKQEFVMNSPYHQMPVDLTRNTAGVYYIELRDGNGKVLATGSTMVRR